jgi:hypothetical protein
MLTKSTELTGEAKVWIKRKNGPGEVIRVVPDMEYNKTVMSYQLYTAFDKNPDHLGQVLFDMQGYWIYDGEVLSVAEQEQVAKFIINYVDRI